MPVTDRLCLSVAGTDPLCSLTQFGLVCMLLSAFAAPCSLGHRMPSPHIVTPPLAHLALQQCDFDLCKACFKKKDTSRGEGVMRGDKGVKVDASAILLDLLLTMSSHRHTALSPPAC